MTCLRSFLRIFHHDCLVEAFRILVKKGLPVSLMLCGDGPERPRIEKLVKNYNLDDKTEFLGSVAHTKIPGILSNTDIYISLSEKDGASASLFEAMASGCFPVVSDIPANRLWIQDGINGRLVSFGDPVQLALVLEELIMERVEMERVSKLNREIAESKLDIKKNTLNFKKLFEDVVQAYDF